MPSHNNQKKSQGGREGGRAGRREVSSRSRASIEVPTRKRVATAARGGMADDGNGLYKLGARGRRESL
jgi:hypothetical protein